MKSLLISLVLATAGAGAMAAEYTNFNTPVGSTVSRVDVRNEAASRVLGRDVLYIGDAAVFQAPVGSTLSRAEAASRVLGRTVIFSEATTFVDSSPSADRAVSVLARMSK